MPPDAPVRRRRHSATPHGVESIPARVCGMDTWVFPRAPLDIRRRLLVLPSITWMSSTSLASSLPPVPKALWAAAGGILLGPVMARAPPPSPMPRTRGGRHHPPASVNPGESKQQAGLDLRHGQVNRPVGVVVGGERAREARAVDLRVDMKRVGQPPGSADTESHVRARMLGRCRAAPDVGASRIQRIDERLPGVPPRDRP